MNRFKKWWTTRDQDLGHPNDLFPTWFLWDDRRDETRGAQLFDVLVDIRNLLVLILLVMLF